MKILTKEEEAAHNKATWEGGIFGGLLGLGLGAAGVAVASKRFPGFRSLSIPFRAFLITSTTTFSGVIVADKYSRAFEKARHPENDYKNSSETAVSQLNAQQSLGTRIKNFVSEQRYPIVFGSWGASMVLAFALVNRNRYLTGQQKLVQARVYAQGLTVAVLVASFALESNDMRVGKGRWETIKVLDPNDPTHQKLIEKRVHHESYAGEDQWMDMIEAQEKKMKERGESVRSTKK